MVMDNVDRQRVVIELDGKMDSRELTAENVSSYLKKYDISDLRWLREHYKKLGTRETLIRYINSAIGVKSRKSGGYRSIRWSGHSTKQLLAELRRLDREIRALEEIEKLINAELDRRKAE